MIREVNRRLVAAARLESHIVRYIQQRYLSLLPSIIDEELKQFCSNETVEVELPLNYVDEDGKFILDGRIDRVIRRSDGSLCVIDYKKSRTIAKEGVYQPMPDRCLPTSFLCMCFCSKRTDGRPNVLPITISKVNDTSLPSVMIRP